MISAMALTMTVPMVAWMRFRGHGWAPCADMSAAMVLPTLAVLALLWTDLLSDVGTLLVIEHAVMLPAMLVAMLLRRPSTPHHHARGGGRVSAPVKLAGFAALLRSSSVARSPSAAPSGPTARARARPARTTRWAATAKPPRPGTARMAPRIPCAACPSPRAV